MPSLSPLRQLLRQQRINCVNANLPWPVRQGRPGRGRVGPDLDRVGPDSDRVGPNSDRVGQAPAESA